MIDTHRQIYGRNRHTEDPILSGPAAIRTFILLTMTDLWRSSKKTSVVCKVALCRFTDREVRADSCTLAVCHGPADKDSSDGGEVGESSRKAEQG